MDPQLLKETVINISQKELSDDQIGILSKGLSFVPTVGVNCFGLKVDLFKCFRQMKLRYFFSKSESGASRTPFRPKSNFCPNVSNHTIHTFCRLVEQDVMGTCSSSNNISHNLSLNEKKALTELTSDPSIIIKPADKGGAIVVQDSEKYQYEILAQLQNIKFYKKLPGDPTNTYRSEILSFLTNAKTEGWISQSEFKFLYCQHPIRPVFYTLPKIHKRLIDPPGRPIVAQTNSLLSPLSQYVDFFIKPFVHSLPSYIRDSTDFINKISELHDLSDASVLLTLDITSLYTNISHEKGLIALRHYLSLREDSSPPSDFIIQMASYLLKYNYFSFDNDFFLQISGTAMGSNFAPNYANLFMGFFEESYIFNTEKNPFHSQIIKWYRYIDDIFCIFLGDHEEAREFVTFLNNLVDDLEFTSEINSVKVHFLDMWVQKNEGCLITTLFTKETDRNTLLLATSFHPIFLKKGLPKSQFYRLRRICHSDSDFVEKSKIMKNNFLSRGYPLDWVEEAFDTAFKKTRSELLRKKTKKSKKYSFSCITTHSPKSFMIKSIFKKHWHLLSSDPELSDIFKHPPLIVYKRARNLKDSLVHARFQSTSPRTSQSLLSPIQKGNYRCGNCAQCNNTFKTSFFCHPRTGRKYSIKSVITCVSTHVVYLIRCPCGIGYVGKTSRQLKQRISEHKSSIRRKDMNYPVAAHFVTLNHDVTSLRFCGIEKVTLPPRGGDIELLLQRRELFWIYTLQTLSPKGMNDEALFNVML